MGNVYVVQETVGRNVTSAAKYGTLKPLLPDVQVLLSPGPTVFKLRKALKTFCDDDYLLLIGDPVAIALAAMTAASINVGKVCFLKWDRESRSYHPVKVDINRRITDEANG